jgi:nucleoside-diphosphate-sugar epimerase
MKNQKIYVAGHRGLIGSTLIRNLKARGYKNLIGKTHQELDLIDQSKTLEFLLTEKPETVLIAAALVGGIHANNTYRAEFIYHNLMVQNNLIWSAHKAGVQNLIFLGSSCIYPKQAPQPMQESALLTGFKGKILQDRTKPDGTPRKLMDSELLKKLGWTPKIDLVSGIKDTVKWYRSEILTKTREQKAS